jgi:hypothetical protein
LISPGKVRLRCATGKAKRGRKRLNAERHSQ